MGRINNNNLTSTLVTMLVTILVTILVTKGVNRSVIKITCFFLFCIFAFANNISKAEGQVEYEIRQLGTGFTVNDINDNAWLVGNINDKATLYNGKPVRLITASGALSSNATSINNHAQIVGSWTYYNDAVAKETPVGFMLNFHDLFSSTTPLFISGYHSTELLAINDSGRAVGYALSGDDMSCALTYTSDPLCIPFDPPVSARATDINLMGDFVANYEASDGVPHAILFPNGGVPHNLDTPQTRPSVVNAMNSNAENLQVVGWFEDDAGVRKAYVHQKGVIQDLGFLPNGIKAEALDVNNKGQIVGTVWVLNDAGEEEQRAFIFT